MNCKKCLYSGNCTIGCDNCFYNSKAELIKCAKTYAFVSNQQCLECKCNGTDCKNKGQCTDAKEE